METGTGGVCGGLFISKNPENNKCFRDMNPLRDYVGPVVITFCYPDYTVGLGIPPSHALRDND